VTKAEIRAATSVFLRDTGVARHYKQDALDAWLELAFQQLVAQLTQANPDFYNTEVVLSMPAAGAMFLSQLEAPSVGVFPFLRPLALTRLETTTSPTGVPYTFQRPRESATVRRDRTAFIRRQTNGTAMAQQLVVNPREGGTFLLHYVYSPLRWGEIEETKEPDFPAPFHSLIAVEGAVAAVSEGGRGNPGRLATVAGELRESFLAFLARFNETGPIMVEITDPVFEDL
jgi:hypothetical protein